MKRRRIIPLAATAALACGGVLAVAPAAHADWEGTITGKVLNADGSPAGDVRVDATGADDGNPATDDGTGDGYTDRNGVYRIDVSRNNTYSLTVNGFTTAQVPAQNATGAAGQITAGPTFTLPAPTPGGTAVPASYSAVVSVVDGTPSKTRVRAQNQTTGDWSPTASVATDGRFYLTGLTAGSYKVYAYSDTSNGSAVNVWSGNQESQRAASVVTIGTQTDLGTLTFPADNLLGTVTGHITVPRVAGFDEWNGSVTFYSMDGKADGIWANSGSTDAAGNFSVDLQPGTYYASAVGYGYQVTNFSAELTGTTSTNHVNTLASYRTATDWYGGTGGLFATAKKIVVAPNGTVSGINFSLSNTLKPIDKPMIKGKFKQGKKISLTQGTWNQTDDLIFSYVWKEGSKVVGTSSSLKLSKKLWKKAKKLSVTVTVKDKTGAMFDGTVTLPVAKTIKAQVRAAKLQLKQDTKKDNKALHQASSV